MTDKVLSTLAMLLEKISCLKHSMSTLIYIVLTDAQPKGNITLLNNTSQLLMVELSTKSM